MFQAVRHEHRSERALLRDVQTLPPDATGSTQGFNGDVVATAKRSLDAGERLDGEGGHTVYGKLLPAAASLAQSALPIGLAHDVVLRNPISAGQSIAWDDVQVDETRDAVRVRRAMEAHFRSNAARR